MQVIAERAEWRVVVHLDTDAEEAGYVYDLVKSGRLQTEHPDRLPLPFRGEFLFKVPSHPRPIPIQVGRFEPTATDVVAGRRGTKLIIPCRRGDRDLLSELENAFRDVPPAAEDEFKSGAVDGVDEFARVQAMTFAQRVIYATRAGQSGRAVLMQQPSSMLLLYLCKNPLIGLLEVMHIAKLPSIDALVAEYIARMIRAKPEWALSEELKLAVACNAKTPIGTALALVTHLSSRSLRQMQKRGDLRAMLKHAALKILLERKD